MLFSFRRSFLFDLGHKIGPASLRALALAMARLDRRIGTR